MRVPSIRIGNTFRVVIRISKNGDYENLEAALSRKIMVRHIESGKAITPSSTVWGEDGVAVHIDGNAMHDPGCYIAAVSYQKYEDRHMQHRLWDGPVFILVEHSWQQNFPGPTGDGPNIPSIEINGVLQFGPDGKSAYEIAVLNGFAGTEQEWLEQLKGEQGNPFVYSDFTPGQLAALKGDKGDTGEQGKQGPKGETGATGAKGDKGDKGDAGAQGPRGNTGATGAAGAKGNTGAAGADGKDGRDGRDFEVPTLDHAPGEATLSYASGGASVAFRIGQQARVFNIAIGEYVFYQLFDLSGGKAVWKLSVSGLVLLPPAPPTRLVFDKTISDTANITGAGQGAVVDILAKMRRCLCKKTAEGKVAIACLDNADSNLYADGSAAVLTGSEGDVMVYKPEFYYKYEAVDADRFAYNIAEKPGDDSWIHSPASLIGAYKSNSVNNKLYSRSGVAPTGSISQANSIVYAKARGTGYNIIDFEQHCMIALLFYAKYGDRNSQKILGAGNANYSETNNGTTNSLGNADTVAATTGHASFAGVEGVHGCAYEWVSGIDINDYVWTATATDGTQRIIGTAPSAESYITELAAANGEHFDLMPIAVSGGSSSTYYADYYYRNVGSCVLLRSAHNAVTDGGVAYMNAAVDSSYAREYIASRLSFRGEIVEAESVAEFKALPLLD